MHLISYINFERMSAIKQDASSMINPPEGFDARMSVVRQLSSTGTLIKSVINYHWMKIFWCARRRREVGSRQSSAHRPLPRVGSIISKFLSIKVNSLKLESAGLPPLIQKKPSPILSAGGEFITVRLDIIAIQRDRSMEHKFKQGTSSEWLSI